MSQPDQTLAHEQLQPKKVLQHIEQSEEKEIANESQVSQAPNRKSVAKSQSSNSLNNVNLQDSIIPDHPQAQSGFKQEQVEEIAKMADDFYYQIGHQQTIHTESPIPEVVCKLDGFYGHDSFKRYNALVLDRDSIIFAAGISYTIFNHFTKEKKVFYSRDRGGVGCIAVHPTKKYFAVGEMGVFPNVYIYEYPSLKLYRILRKGTQKSYSSICFSGDGDKLASVGSDPDYLITVWQWKQQKLLLKSKAFSQQVYRVTFSQFNQKWLTTSGTGHIRFWKISQTFTGLKLQGDIAKFGQFQLSDVISYAQFQDGNVLSSSQYGKLLLWEGNLIKSVVSIDQNTPCHNGPIEYVRLHDKKIITAGADGYIKFWDYISINQGQSDEHFNLFIKPQRTIYFQSNSKTPAYLNWISIQTDYWIVQDALGTIWKYHPDTDKRQSLITFNAGKFTDFAISPLNNCLITTGFDGYMRLWDYGNRKEFYHRKFATKSQSTCIDWLPFSKRNCGRMVVVGFNDGIVRFVGLEEKAFVLIKAFKVHKMPILKVKSNRDGTVVAVIDTAGSIFFLALDTVTLNKIVPYCLFETGFKINDVSWDNTGDKLLLACQDGRLHQLNVPKEKDCDYSQTYLKSFTIRSITVKMMESQKPNRQELELELLLKKTKGAVVDETIVDQEWEPCPIMNATYYGTDCSKIICSVQGNFLGYFYIVDFTKERPIASIQAPKLKTSYLNYNQQSDILFVGYRNGTWQLRHKYNPLVYLKKHCFDQNIGIVRKIAMNIQNSALIAVSQDGTMLVHKFDLASFHKGVRGQTVDAVQVSIPTVILGISASTFSDKIDFGKQIQVDVVDNSIYCLQDEKLKAEQDMKLTEAEKIKNKKMNKIKQLQELFKEIVQANKNETDNLAKLTPAELIVDPEYTAAFQKRVDQEEEETRKELQWDQEYAELGKKKLQKYFTENLEFDKFKVKGIKKPIIVSSFKMKKLTPFIKSQLQKIQKIIQEEQLSQGPDKKNTTVSSFEQSKAILQMKMKDQKKGKQENQQVKNKIRQAELQFQKQLTLANATKGDYKLKCSPDYVVPQNERLNVSRKKKHLFLHYQYLFEEKKQFNTCLNKLRITKKELVDKLQSLNQRLRKINKELGVEEEDILFEIDEDVETIEADIEVTQEDINEHVLAKQKEKQASKKTGGMGMSSNQPVQQKKDTVQRIKRPKKKTHIQKKEQKSTGMQIKPRNNMRIHKSPLQDQVRQIRRIKLEAEKQKLKSDLQSQISKFDDELQSLKLMKYQLQSDLNLVQMKLLTFSQQFIIFRDMETYDNSLMWQLTTLSTERGILESTFINLSQEINDVQLLNDDIKKKFQDQKKILKEFVYPEDDQMRERIIKYYKIRERKRISKLKKQAELEEKEKESENEDSQEEEEQEDEDSQDDEFEDQDEKPDITVIQNDHKNFQRVRKICEYDQKIEEYSKKKSDLEKQRNQITTKIKNINVSLTTAEKQLQAFQKKKLQKVNQVIVSLPIKFSQIQYHYGVNGKLRLHQQFNKQTNNAILFTRPAFVKLGERIEELKKQKIDIEKKQKNLNKKLTKLGEQVQKASQTIQSKKKEYEQKQLLKFGSTFQLQKLKQLQPTDQVLEMRQMYKKQERQASRKIEQIKEDLQERKRELLEAKRANTKVITEITELGDKENDLKKMLDSTNKQLFKNIDVSKKDELDKERQNLKDLIKFLSKEIEDLKTEIGLFKRKGGHIYTMVTSNKKNFS